MGAYADGQIRWGRVGWDAAVGIGDKDEGFAGEDRSLICGALTLWDPYVKE